MGNFTRSLTRTAGAAVLGQQAGADAVDIETEMEASVTRSSAETAQYDDGSIADYAATRWLIPLPYPDASVTRSVELRIQWLRELGSITAVLHRIKTDPAWPKLGKIPVVLGRRWAPGHPVDWRKATRTRLKRWYASPALYGVYAASSTMQNPMAGQQPPTEQTR